jgi:hypothetical protein
MPSFHVLQYKGVKKKMMEEAECEAKKTAIYCHLLFQIYRRQFQIFNLLSLWNSIADASINHDVPNKKL